MDILDQPITLKQALGAAIVMAIIPSSSYWFAQKLTGLDSTATLGIKELINQVKVELIAAEREMRERKEASLFDLKELEMEIHFVVRSGAEAKVEVVGIGGGFEATDEKTQKLRLTWVATPPITAVVKKGGVSGPPSIFMTPATTQSTPPSPGVPR